MDDNPANVLLIVRLLEHSGFKNLRSTYESTEVVPLCQSWNPDIVILDLHMPKKSGYEVLAELVETTNKEDYLPVLVFTADVSPEAKRRALEAGAADFLTKPGDATEIILRVSNFLRMRLLYQSLAEQKRDLEARVRERTFELELAQREVIDRLAMAAEYRDDDTGEHARRVGELSARIAAELGLPRDDVETIRLAAPLHDLGKIGISDLILLKPGKLTPEEFETIKDHTRIGAQVLSGSSSPLLSAAECIALSHHERWDGSGYPQQLAGEAIPLYGRIVAVADVYDALTSERPYKVAMSHDAATAEIVRMSGSQFDPQIVEAFLRAVACEAPEISAPRAA